MEEHPAEQANNQADEPKPDIAPGRAHFLGSPEEGKQAIKDLQDGKRGDILLGHRGQAISVKAVINSGKSATRSYTIRRSQHHE
jgi:hypothetical protein